mmetsp:Transcript_20117/g.62095  ORF Transcript_20117/g.62095 Transcript_20117/m.62095 type:complete len:223 (-) Transcript_20117:1103-1771(-)
MGAGRLKFTTRGRTSEQRSKASFQSPSLSSKIQPASDAAAVRVTGCSFPNLEEARSRVSRNSAPALRQASHCASHASTTSGAQHVGRGRSWPSDPCHCALSAASSCARQISSTGFESCFSALASSIPRKLCAIEAVLSRHNKRAALSDVRCTSRHRSYNRAANSYSSMPPYPKNLARPFSLGTSVHDAARSLTRPSSDLSWLMPMSMRSFMRESTSAIEPAK